MPMYHFCLRDTDELNDVDGTVLSDLDAARSHATQVARELMFKRDSMLHQDWARWTMSVRDTAGQELLSFVLTDFQHTKPNGEN